MIGSVYLRNPKASFFIGDANLMDAGLFDRYELQCNIPCSVCRRQDGLLRECPICGTPANECGWPACKCGCMTVTCGHRADRMVSGIAIPKVLAITLAITDIQEDII